MHSPSGWGVVGTTRNTMQQCRPQTYSLVLLAGTHLRPEVTGEFVILLMSAGQFLASTFHKITLTLLWLPPQWFCWLQPQCTALECSHCHQAYCLIAAICFAAAAYSVEIL